MIGNEGEANGWKEEEEEVKERLVERIERKGLIHSFLKEGGRGRGAISPAFMVVQLTNTELGKVMGQFRSPKHCRFFGFVFLSFHFTISPRG